jgi:mono/diheme cytochrome c family protein/glucose/arabinose dehydrogenase
MAKTPIAGFDSNREPTTREPAKRTFRRAVLALITAFAMTAALTSVAGTQGTQTPAPGAAGGQAGRGAPPAPGRAGGPGLADPVNAGGDYSPKPPVAALSPDEQAKRFILPPGYRLELVLSDPDIVSPAAMAFDGNGRLYVAELRSYMLDADAGRQHEPTSRISMHESTKGDGKFDRHTVFADNLLFPRMILPLDKEILTNETHSDDVLRLADTNGDGVADRRQVFYTGVGAGRSGNVQQAQSGFVWALDNWIYSTYNAFRFRWTPKGILREPSGPPGAEWGMSMDDDGKIWLVNAAGERGPANFQIPIQYGAFLVPDQWEDGFDIPYPAPGIGDMQGGLPRVRLPANNLNHFTSTTGPEIVRSDRYPADLNGDLLFADPVGRFIRRAKIVKTAGISQVRNAYPGAEFIISTDPLFRPVNIKTGPDGAIYILDMYHGIIQDANWTARGTYLRYKIEQYGLDKVVGHGRIWRLRYDGVPASQTPAGIAGQPAIPGVELHKTWPRMLDETPAQLVAHLTNPIGWWRDTAQRLLVLRQDKSVVPALQQLVRRGSDPAVQGSDPLRGRFHALWTLEGLGALDAALVREQMKDPSPRMRVQALRASETLYKAGNRTLDADYRAMAEDPDTDVSIQALLTLNVLKAPDLAKVVAAAQAANKARGIKEIGDFLLKPAAAAPTTLGGAPLTPEQQKVIEEGDAIYKSTCFSCHGEDGRGAPKAGAAPGATLAPSLAGSPRVNAHRDYVVKVLLKGLTGPLDAATSSSGDVMVPMGTNKDEWIAAIASYVRMGFGNAGGLVTAADVARVRAATANRKAPWTLKELEPTLPRRIEGTSSWKLTASHNAETAGVALTTRGWTTGVPQAPGMWLQIELPQPAMVTEIEFDSPGAPAGRGGGRGGGGAPPALPYPRGYRVEVSMDGTNWGKPVAEGKGAGARTTVTFAPTRAKFVRVTQTDAGEGAPNWTVSNLKVYEASPGKS